MNQMRGLTARAAALLVALPLCAAAAPRAAASEAQTGEAVPSRWQSHQSTFTYAGTTTAYTCEGLEERMRRLLMWLGARPEHMHIYAGACPGGPNAPSQNIVVRVQFDSLLPVGEKATDESSPAIKGEWVPVTLRPNGAPSMGEGDCELLQGLKEFITQNFALRGLQYRTDCFPHTISLNSYEVSAQVLKPVHSGPAPQPAS